MICDLNPDNWTVKNWSFPQQCPGWEWSGVMKASKFSDVQKAFSLKQGADGIPVA